MLSPRVLIESKEALIAVKPHGMLSVPSRKGERDLRPCLGLVLEQELKTRLWPVHRLDFEVGGLIVFAKSAEAHRILNSAFEQRLVIKDYIALSRLPAGMQPFEGVETWESLLVKGKKRSFEAPYGKPSQTEARFTRRIEAHDQRNHNRHDQSYGVWHLRPRTGRPHQLRFEMAKRGLPIFGDELYGADPVSQPGWIALRAIRLDFTALRAELDHSAWRRLGLIQPGLIQDINSACIQLPETMQSAWEDAFLAEGLFR